MRQLSVHRDVVKELNRLPAKQYRQVASVIFDLLNDPTPQNSKPLKGSDYWRVSVGEYRVVYRHSDELIRVAVCGKRNDGDVYRRLSRLT